MSKIIKIMIIWFVIGMLYFTLEGFWRIPTGGYANIIMMPIGGFCGACVGLINEYPKAKNMAIYKQAIIGTVIVLIIEYISGCFLNIKIGLDIWDYSDKFLNLNGQICLPFAFAWFLLMPFCIWFDDFLRYKLFYKDSHIGLISTYKNFISGR